MSVWVWWALVLSATAHAWRSWGPARGLLAGALLWFASSFLPFDERITAVVALVVAVRADRVGRAASDPGASSGS